MRHKYLVLFAVMVCCLIATVAWAQVPNPTFIRGDVDADGDVDSDDATLLHDYYYGGGNPPLGCQLAGDFDDNGIIELYDWLGLDAFVNASGAPPAAPYPDCGPDPTDPQPGVNCCYIPPQHIPSISPLGVLALVFLMMGCAFWVIRKKRLATINR